MAAPTLRSLSVPCLLLAAPWTILGGRVAITGSVKPHEAGLGLTLEQRDGGEYDHAVTMDPGCYNAWNGDAWVDYILGP